jgi:hypothetical protein
MAIKEKPYLTKDSFIIISKAATIPINVRYALGDAFHEPETPNF